MNAETRLNRMEAELQRLQRDTRASMPRAANPNTPPAVRLAKVTANCDTSSPTSDPSWWVYKIKFVDGSFTENAEAQSASSTVRDETEYFAAAPSGSSHLEVDSLVHVVRREGQWWILTAPQAVEILSGSPTAFYDKGHGPPYTTVGNFNLTGGGTVEVVLHSGAYFQGFSYPLEKVGSTYYAIPHDTTLEGTADEAGDPGDTITVNAFVTAAAGTVPTDSGNDILARIAGTSSLENGDSVIVLYSEWAFGDGADAIWAGWICFKTGGSTANLTGVASSFGDAGSTINFTTAAGTKAAFVPSGLVASGGTHTLVWTDDDHYVVLDPLLAVTGNCDAFASAADGDTDFTVDGNTVNADITRGLCLAGKNYGLIWADGGGWAVVDPEMEFIGVPTAVVTAGSPATFSVYAGTKGSETDTTNDLDGLVRQGLVFTGKRYRVVWVDLGWEVDDYSTEFTGTAAADIPLNASATQLIFTGTGGSETSSGVSVTVRNAYGSISSGQRVRCAWCAWSGDFEYVNARCP